MQTVSEIYNRVIINYCKYCKEISRSNPFTKYFYINAINIAGSIEGNQFIYFSQVLNIQKAVPEFKKINSQIRLLNSVDLKEVKKDVNKMYYIAGGILLLGLIISIANSNNEKLAQIGSGIFCSGFVAYIYFWIFPIGKAKELKKNVKKMRNDYPPEV